MSGVAGHVTRPERDASPERRPHVVIVGAGFAGLEAAKRLLRAPVDITLIDRRNYHLFQPLLYQVATAALSPADIAVPIRGVLHAGRHASLRVLLEQVIGIDLEAKRVLTRDAAPTGYDYLVLATGSEYSYFGHDADWAPLAPGLKSLDDATDIRRRVLLAFERAERETDEARRSALMTFVVVGGGPTGVEMAGALAEMARLSLSRDFRHIVPSSARIILLEAGPSVLSAFPEPLREAARADLLKLGVHVRMNTPVTDVGKGHVAVGAEIIRAETIIWAAGVAASPLGATLGVPLDRAGRVLVEPDLTIPGYKNVFVIGDLASLNGEDGRPLPGVAQVALQMGKHAARQVMRGIEKQPYRPFQYNNLGNMATIGRNSAVGDFGFMRISGYIGWLAWLFVHILNLIGFRNRLVVMMQWAWSYFSYQRAIRLITGDPPPTS